MILEAPRPSLVQLFGAEVTVSTTGVAGDQTADGTPPGTVYIGTSLEGSVATTVNRFTGSPEEICDQARHQALLDLIERLEAGA